MELLRILLVHFLIAIVMTLGFVVIPLVLELAQRLVDRRRYGRQGAAAPSLAFMARPRRR